MAEEKDKKTTDASATSTSSAQKSSAQEASGQASSSPTGESGQVEEKSTSVSDTDTLATSEDSVQEKEEDLGKSLDLEPKKDTNASSPTGESAQEKKEIFGDELPDDIKKKLEERKNDKKSSPKKGRKKKKEKVKIDTGKVFIKATYNNTMVTITDLNGNVVSWASAGLAGFRGPKKATSYAAQIITKIACMKAKEEYGLKDVSVFISGVGTGRESAVRSINANGLNVTMIKDVTPIPHNGCRPKKPRRV